jgi:hypothetical protein
MATKSVYGLRNSEIQIQSKLSFVKRVVRACWEANQRTYLAATTDPKTGRANLALERQVALMMLG